ncbi:54S ribosomal protein L2 mitochondrial [Chamberlinius hualienensis]
MALASLISAFRNVSITGRSCIKSVLGSESINNTNVIKEFVRSVGRDNPFKYIRGRKTYCYKRIVHYPENYTTRPLPITKLGGRDPVTGRVVAARIGGGCKQKYRWIAYQRALADGEKDIIERVINVRYDPIRTGRIALVAHGDTKRWIIATENMKIGDLIKTSSEIPRIPVRPNEGDCYRLGALPVGTAVNCVEFLPGVGGYYGRAAGTSCKLVRKSEGRAIIQLPSRQEVSVDEKCAGIVGRISNVDHNKQIIGSAKRNRWMGNRPRTGLWHRKDGYCGRKIRPLPPMKFITGSGRPPVIPPYTLTY